MVGTLDIRLVNYLRPLICTLTHMKIKILVNVPCRKSLFSNVAWHFFHLKQKISTKLKVTYNAVLSYSHIIIIPIYDRENIGS